MKTLERILVWFCSIVIVGVICLAYVVYPTVAKELKPMREMWNRIERIESVINRLQKPFREGEEVRANF